MSRKACRPPKRFDSLQASSRAMARARAVGGEPYFGLTGAHLLEPVPWTW